jgi:hypothetical protein
MELLALLKLDLELAAAPVAIAGAANLTDRIDMRRLSADATVRVIVPPSTLRLALTFLAAMLAGVTLTIPLW